MSDQSRRPEPEPSELEARPWDDSSLPAQELPFQDLVAPEPIDAAPPTPARYLAFGAVLIGGVLGAMIGWGVGDLMEGETGAAVGAVLGGLTGAIGVGLLANLTLRAMNEWRTVEHPEAAAQPAVGGDERLDAAKNLSRRLTERDQTDGANGSNGSTETDRPTPGTERGETS